MPTLITKGAMSVQAFGAITGGSNQPTQNYWIAAVQATSVTDFVAQDNSSVLFDNNGDIFLSVVSSFSFLPSNPIKRLSIKFDKTNGNIVWQNFLGTNLSGLDLYSRSIATDGTNFYATYANGNTTLNVVNGINKYDSSGTVVWQKDRVITTQPTPSTFKYIDCVAVKEISSGGVLGSINIDSGSYFGFGWAELNSSGSLINTSFYNVPFYPNQITLWKMNSNASDEFIQIIISEGTSGSGGGQVIAVKLNSSGIILWSKLLNITGSENYFGPTSCAIDSAGNSYWSYQKAGTQSVIVKLDSSGASIFEIRFPVFINDICVDSADNLYAVSEFGVIFSFNSSGTQLWQNQLSNSNPNFYVESIDANSATQSLSIYGNSYTDINETFLFVAKLPLNGSGTGATVYNLYGDLLTYQQAINTVTSGTPVTTNVSFTTLSEGYTLNSGSVSPSLSSLPEEVQFI